MAHSPPSDHERTNDRLVRPLRISKQMRPFVERMRLGRKNLDLSDPATALQFERKQDEMRRILAATKVSSAKMKRAIERTLDAAVNHRLQAVRQEDRKRDRLRSKDDVDKLMKRLTELAAAIAKLPPNAKKKLNAIVASHTEQFFDTETFAAIITDIAAALPKLAPRKPRRMRSMSSISRFLRLSAPRRQKSLSSGKRCQPGQDRKSS